ncbi:serine/threonine protein kinase [Methanogenium sp. S4BF]|nr:serine/threonine protein kinase [Methanogenium sp. S4BF]
MGEGAYAYVYEAKRLADGLPFAIKQLSIIDDDSVHRFKREVAIQSSLKHDNIVKIIDHSVDNDPFQFVMPLAECNLKAFLERYGSSESNIWIFFQIAEGLKYAHNMGIIHRDLKPENILYIYDHLRDKYQFAICDFGLGRNITTESQNITVKGDLIGTYEYMSPEQYQNPQSVNHLSDIYSLGKLLYEILTGEIPYPDINYDKIPPKFRYIIQKACNSNPKDRYQSVEEIISDVELVTSNTKEFQKVELLAIEDIEDLIANNDNSRENIERLITLITENQGNMKLLFQTFPNIPNQKLTLIINNHKEAFLGILKIYDKAVSGSQNFEYCDTVANFYNKIYHMTQSFDIRQIILRRLPSLAYENNRFYVGKVFAQIVQQTTDISEILLIKEVLESNRHLANWIKGYFDMSKIPKIIRDIYS